MTKKPMMTFDDESEEYLNYTKFYNDVFSVFNKKKDDEMANGDVDVDCKRPVTMSTVIGTKTPSKLGSKRSMGSFYSLLELDKGDLIEFKKLHIENPNFLYEKNEVDQWLPIHFAASKAKINVIEYILKNTKPGMIDEQDAHGNTSLHIAIAKGYIECCKFLLSQKADLTIKNNESSAALHHCVIHSKPDILELILKYGHDVNVNIGGKHNQTALHYCATTDVIECAKLLVKYGCDMCRSCDIGFRPVHLATTSCSNKVLDFLLNEGAKKGCSKLRQLSFVDIDNNKPLHAAVQVCNIKAVLLCLENGATIDETSDTDYSTPVHIACAQGSLEILKIMFEKQPDHKEKVIHMVDSSQMTPLHKACMFDHADVADYLLRHGADIDAYDKEKRTPLLTSVSRNCIKTACLLINRSANFRVKDIHLQNVFHLTVLNQQTNILKLDNDNSTASKDLNHQNQSLKLHALETISQSLMQRTTKFGDLLNEQDNDGCTVVHYATKLGFVNDLRTLLNFGANIATLNNDNQSPLHFAARYGRYNSCMQILLSENYKNYINEKDSFGQTPLHLASHNGHTKVIKLLLEKGALTYKSFVGNTPFHEAASNGHINCMNVFQALDANSVNAVNKNGDTPLHMAAKEGHSSTVEVLLNIGALFTANNDGLTFIDLAISNRHDSVLLSIIAHERWQEALDLSSKLYKTPFLGIIQFSAEVSQAILDRCISRQDVEGSNGKKYTVTYNFKYLNWADHDNGTNVKGGAMLPLQYMVKYARTDCLTHKLCETLLSRKWKRYGLPCYIFVLSFYLLFLAAITLIVGTYPSCIHDDVYGYYSTNNTTDCFNIINERNTHEVFQYFNENHVYVVLASFCLFYTLFSIFEETVKVAIDGLNYFKNFQVFVQLVLFISTALFCVPFLYRTEYTLHYQWEAGAIAIFTAWFNLLLYMQIFYGLGIYVVMYTEILKTLMKAISLFSILIIAFSLVFYILLQDENSKGNSTPGISFMNTIIMMIGEIGTLNLYIKPFTDKTPYSLHFGVMIFAFLILFVILMPILLTNLLIGLAVGDIDSIRKNAKLKREAMQIQLYIEMETKMPKRIFDKLNEMSYKEVFDETICNGKSLLAFFGNDKVEDPDIKEHNDGDNLVYLEMLKQKRKVVSMKGTMDQQTDLIKLILQKMEIKTEENDNDISCARGEPDKAKGLWNSGIKNARLRNFMLHQFVARQENQQ